MTLARFPAGMVADAAADFGLLALLNNANIYCGHLEVIATSGTNTTLTTAQCRRACIRLTSGASGGFTVTLPSTKSIISSFGPTIITDGSFGFLFRVLNDGVGQTGTLTVGDASTTITGTATILTDTRRDFFCMVTSATTLNYYNIGSASI